MDLGEERPRELSTLKREDVQPRGKLDRHAPPDDALDYVMDGLPPYAELLRQ
jgi:hypothetical protein